MERADRFRPIAERVAATHGLEIFDVLFRREAHGWVLRVVIDRPGLADTQGRPGAPADSVSVEDCQRVSHDLSAVLDVEDVVDRAYTLEVSSPGLDRPLRGPADYERFRGRLAHIVTSDEVEGQKSFRGRLQGFEDGHVVLTGDGGRVYRVPVPLVSRARLVVEF